jgi:putative heme-binding domain-containing protein
LEVLQNRSLAFQLRLAALHSLAQADPRAGLDALKAILPTLDEGQRNLLATVMSATKQGAGLLMQVHDENLLEITAFDLASAERTHRANRKDPRGVAILNQVKKLAAAEKKAFQQKLDRFMKIAEANGGNGAAGKVLFESNCLLCHKVGAKGQEIAPALDGSAYRGNEALLTALLDPNAAIEGGYVVYRISKKDGSSLEGFLFKKDERGVTLAFMGGATVFTPASEIRSDGFVAGRSFMPAGLIDGWNDGQIADLLAYIRSIK